MNYSFRRLPGRLFYCLISLILAARLAHATGPATTTVSDIVYRADSSPAAGKPRTEILQLVAMNQLDLIEPLMTNEADRAFLKDILESRKNLRDRFNFEAADMNTPSSASR